MAKTGFNAQEWATQTFDSFIVPQFITAPNTQIQNRALVSDTSNMFQALGPVERVPFKSLNLLPKEFGPAFEQVWELENKDSRIRFVGQWADLSNGSGNRPNAGVSGDFMEVTFYGTGINFIWYASGNTTTNTLAVDGGSSVSMALPSATNFGARSYAIQQVYPAVSNLTLGWHTIKYANTGGAELQGIEILNQASVVTVTPGSAFVGPRKESLATASSSAFNAGFVGTLGGRVAKHSLGGVISQVVRECAVSPSYLTSADHTNEEQVRRIPFWEFGFNRADDFSTTAGTVTSRTGTLDDGTTTLSALNATLQFTNQLTVQAATTNSYSLTFVGTGLDVVSTCDTGITRTINFTVDGVSAGSIVTTTAQVNVVRKIVSGLPYGTHVVKFQNGSASDVTWGVSEFIIYQPKAPTIPVGAILVADYNLPANYVASTSGAVGFVPQGTIRKMLSTREALYTGTWGSPSVSPTSFNSGITLNSLTNGDTVSYTFYGTGFEWRAIGTSGGVNAGTLSVDGSTNLSGFTTSLVQTSSGMTFTAATGVLAGTNAADNNFRVQVSNLSLGLHTVKWTHNSTVAFWTDVIDIIVPAHINNPTFKVGSMSLFDNAKVEAIKASVDNQPDLGKNKAWVIYDPNASKILASFNVSQVLQGATGAFVVYFTKAFKTKNYGMASSTRATGSGSNRYMTQGDTTDNSTSFCRIYQNANTSNAAISDTVFYAEFIGELAEE